MLSSNSKIVNELENCSEESTHNKGQQGTRMSNGMDLSRRKVSTSMEKHNLSAGDCTGSNNQDFLYSMKHNYIGKGRSM